jgi:hypothetical protein
MKQYGYDRKTGALFSWNSGLEFHGTQTFPPEGSFLSSDRVLDSMIGSLFLSGWTGLFGVLRCDGKKAFLAGWGQNGHWIGSELPNDSLEANPPIPLCVYGDVVKSPEKMADLCFRFSNSRMYVCSLVDELPALGALARNIRVTPFRSILAWENTTSIDAESKTYEKDLNGDAMGRMADVVANGLCAVNDVKTTVGVSPFYGKTLHKDWKEGCQFIVRTAEMDNLFPSVPISAKHYAATSVPVRMENTEQFREQTGYNGSHVDVFVATDWLPDVSTFMRFYKTFSGRGFVCASDQNKIRHNRYVPVFRSDRCYRVPREKYEQTH